MNELNVRREEEKEDYFPVKWLPFGPVDQAFHFPPSTGHNKILGIAFTAAIAWQSHQIQSWDILTSVSFLGSGRKFTLLCLWKTSEFWGISWHVSCCYKMKSMIACFFASWNNIRIFKPFWSWLFTGKRNHSCRGGYCILYCLEEIFWLNDIPVFFPIKFL